VAVARNRWRTPEDARGLKGGLIGPNAVLQLVPVLEAHEPGLGARLMTLAGLDALPSDQGLMPEGPAARLHGAVRRELPGAAPAILSEAGRRTADYILAHRIPPMAQRLLRALPPALAGPLLQKAIARNAWTFAGSGRFSVVAPLTFEVAANPLVAGETARSCQCHWHVAVFERLFRSLVDDRLTAQETGCCTCGDSACRFELRRAG
jgi:divinyl protochlorophyllide a 8-vinyl-reductase